MEYKRKIWFMTAKQREQEEKKNRIHTHTLRCQEFADELLAVLLVQTPEMAESIMKTFDKILYWE